MSECAENAAEPEIASPDFGTDEPADLAPGSLILDVTDLLGRFADHRLPTYATRVQMEIAAHLASSKVGRPALLTHFSRSRGGWKQVAAAPFAALVAASKAGTDGEEPGWIARREQVIAAEESATFPPGSTLLSFAGPSQGDDHALRIRHLKHTHGIAFVPLIHDLAALTSREGGHDEGAARCLRWLVGILDDADHILTPSQAVKDDLIAIAVGMGRAIDPDHITVVVPDADYYQPSAALWQGTLPEGVDDPFVLIAAPIEAHQKQLAVLDAWRELMNRHGSEQVPHLILTGDMGPGGEGVLERLSLDPELEQRVMILPGLDDDRMAALYAAARFTLHAGRWDGWAVPVTSSLAFGTPALAARTPSLVEAGGDTAAYFDAASPRSLVSKVDELRSDPAVLAAYRDRARVFRPRSWATIAEEFRAAALVGEAVVHDPASVFPRARRGAYYPLRQDNARSPWPGIANNERFRWGLGWHEMEPWGCWTKSVGAEIAFTLADPGEVRLALCVRLPGARMEQVTVVEPTGAVLASSTIEPGVPRWLIVRLCPVDGLIRVSLRSRASFQEGNGGRCLSAGLSGIFVFTEADRGEFELVEAIALGSLIDYDPHRRHFARASSGD